MIGQQLELFHQYSPTWEDVQKGRAELVYRYEPCNRCDGEAMGFWRQGRCTHTSGNYAYPKQQPDGTCRRGYLEWSW